MFNFYVIRFGVFSVQNEVTYRLKKGKIAAKMVLSTPVCAFHWV